MANQPGSYPLKLSTNGESSYPDAEALFRDLRNRDPTIQHLWSHQADIIRAYHLHVEEPDIALELPTGTGKTLVGMLIAEWRRRTRHERIVYLCPTKQLANQVGALASKYGVTTHVLVGPQDQYPPENYARYASGDAIAITTYSAIFNINPRLDNAQILILDDAHAGENYISSLWSLEISRSNHKDLYDAIIGLFRAEISGDILPDLLDDAANSIQRTNVDLLPGPKVFDRVDALTLLIDQYATWENKLRFPWTLIRGRLTACCMLFSWSEILIRPSIPPSMTHNAFANPRQRLYMSATIGASGELERITGIPTIYRIPAPPGWEQQSTGRKLFLFPDASFTEEQYLPWLADHVRTHNRTLVLTPHKHSADSFKQLMSSSELTHEILEAQDVEQSLNAFTSHTSAVLLLTNRYDGIDLPGDTCRSLIVFGLPASVNLYERLLWSKLGISPILADRIRTRITQAVGRCTRNPTDYAIIIMTGRDLFEYCITRENRADLHPELRAEIEFGLENSQSEDIGRLSYLARIFLDRCSEWDSAEADITHRRGEPARVAPEYIEVLRGIVRMEVDFQYSLWRQDYISALEKASLIVDRLSGDHLIGYRALWNYFAGCTAYLHAVHTGKDEFRKVASDRFQRASHASKAILWFAKLSHELKPSQDTDERTSIEHALAVESIKRKLSRIGMVGPTFEKEIVRLRGFITQNAPSNFENALTELGNMLGFTANKPSEDASPDSMWILGTGIVILFEAKSDEAKEGSISVRTCRQALGHLPWLNCRPFFTQEAKVTTVIVSPRSTLDSKAIPYAEGLYYISLEDIRSLFIASETCLRKIRSLCAGLEEEKIYEVILENITTAKLNTDDILSYLHRIKLIDLPRS